MKTMQFRNYLAIQYLASPRELTALTSLQAEPISACKLKLHIRVHWNLSGSNVKQDAKRCDKM